jgi:alkanesulfonate monooxygenase SsuD/methylene tetrahydromethanopterin reductase-like flavin-dependent oxidoreductase (luciferase family)
VISGGRLNFGIGAGWYEEEHRSYGFPFESFGSRAERLVEAIQLIKLMWTKGEASFEGKYYRVDKVVSEPKPLQKPHPPIWIGAEGDRMLKIAAQVADVWNFPSDMHFYPPEEYAEKIRKFETACQSCGRSTDEIVKSWLGIVLVDRNRANVAEKVERFRPSEVPFERYMNSVAGTSAECVEKLKLYSRLGVSHFILVFPDLPDLKTAQIFAREVMPAFR